MIDGVLDSEDEYVLDKYAYNEGKAASAVGASSKANPYDKNSRPHSLWKMGYSYDNSIGTA